MGTSATVALSQTELFSTLSADEVAAVVASARRCVFPHGSTLMREGEASDTFHVILRGRVRVERRHPELGTVVVLAELGPGEIVGELGVLFQQQRSATVEAIEDTETLEWDAASLREAIERFPGFAAALLQVLARRLLRANEVVDEAMRELHWSEAALEQRVRKLRSLVQVAEQAHRLVRQLNQEIAQIRAAEPLASPVGYSLGICLGDVEIASSRVGGLRNELEELANTLGQRAN